MADLKKLREKRNTLFAEGADLFKSIEEETRSLTEDEKGHLIEIRSQIEELDESIKQEKEFRSAEGVLEDTTEVSEQQEEKEDILDMENVEQRSMELYLRGQQETKEYRDLEASMTVGNSVENTAGNGGVTVPTAVLSQIIMKLEQQSPVFAMAEVLPSTTGRLTIARETKASDDEGFIGELVNAPKLTAALKTITLDQKRVAASFQLTNDLINDSAVDIVSYAVNRVARAIGRTISRNILIGAQGSEKATDTFRPVLTDSEIMIEDLGSEITVEGLIQMYADLHQAYQSGAAWVMSKSVFDKIAKLKDGDGRYLIFQGLVDGNPEYRLFNAPVYVEDVMDKAADKQIVFGNFHEGYAVLVKQAMHLVHVTADTTQALAGGHLVVMDAYLDGAVKNPDAFIIGKTGSAVKPPVVK